MIIPTRDVEDWITELLRSILTQTLRRIEVIVVDDGSTDATRSLIDAFGDDRVQVVANPGSGGAAARNHGVALATGRYLAFADGDDFVPSTAYESLVAQADLSGSAMVIGNHLVLEPHRTTTRQTSLPIYGTTRTGIRIDDEPRFLRDRICWNRVVRRSDWLDHGIRFADARRSNDIFAMVQCYCAFSFDVLPQPVYAYRRRVGSTSMTANKLAFGSVLDHLEQETNCAVALADLDSPATIETYFAGILQFDIWAHAREVIIGQSAWSDQHIGELRERLQLLVKLAPEAAFQRIPRWKAVAYLLGRRGCWDSAADIARDMKERPLATVSTAERVARDVGGLDVSGAVEHALLAIIIEPLLERRGALGDDELAESRRAFAAYVAAAKPRLDRRHRRVAAALRRRPHRARVALDRVDDPDIVRRGYRSLRRRGGAVLRTIGVRR